MRRYQPLPGKKMWYEFTFDAAHPQNQAITLRFVITAPVPFARDLPPGSVIETHIRWREEETRGR